MQAQAREAPILWLGSAGLADSDRQRLARSMDEAAAAAAWRFSSLAEADAWVFHGERVQSLGKGEIEVRPGDAAGERPLRLSLRDINRPVAFCTPLPDAFEPLCRFDLDSPPSVEAALRRLEIWLRPTRARFALGREVVAAGANLRHGVFHVSNAEDGKLLAVLNFRSGKAAVAPDLHPAQLAEAQWDKRPSGAGKPPPGFDALTTSQLSWTYVRHSAGRHLPAHYRERPIHYRGMPRVPLQWLSDSQLAILRSLFAGPAPLAVLQEHLGLPPERLEQELACLYYASAITTTRAKAAQSRGQRSDEGSTWTSVNQGMRSTRSGIGGGAEADAGPSTHGITVPAWLTGKPG